MTSRVSLLRSTLLAMAVVLGAGQARAEDEFELSVAGRGVALVAKGDWHVNAEYPWKVIVGGETIDKSKFVLTEKSATVSGLPPGAAKLKGAVCDGPRCMPFIKEFTVQ